MNAEQLNLYFSRLDRLQKAIAGQFPKEIIAQFALALAEVGLGGSVEMCRYFLNYKRQLRGEWTAEEEIEFEQMDEYEKAEEARMLEELKRDYTPNPQAVSRFLNDRKNIGSRLYMYALEGNSKRFDEVFEDAMIERYSKSVLRVDGGRAEVWRKIESPEDSEEILTIKGE